MSKQKSYCTDALAKNICWAMSEDLGLSHQYNGDPRLWTMQYTPLESRPFKRHYQLSEILKKYVFQKDIYSQEDVMKMSVEKFMDNQKRLNSFKPNMDNLVRDAVFRAKGWIDQLLLDYDLDEHLQACYWPKRASVGVPRKNATLENRWLTVITGSSQHCEWFDHIYLPWFGHAETLRSSLDVVEVDYLNAVLVDKTFKSKRMIVPNTSIGGLYSNGLGKIMEQRLAKGGYHIGGPKPLPDVHRILAQESSLTGRNATVDQRLASDNITEDLISLTFPLRWAKALLFGRINVLEVEGEPVVTKTMSTMGIGFTFPMQMVLFLGLAHACRSIWEDSHGAMPEGSVISVFGDDLICPVELKDLITHVFESLGLVFNTDKTFWCGPFRESCGGDYFRGADVRPAFLPPGGEGMTERHYEAWLYKSYNALIRRWDYSEIPQTLRLIENELLAIRPSGCYIVPNSFSDDAGLKVPVGEANPAIHRIPHRDVHGTYTFRYLRKEATTKRIDFHDCYMWERFRVVGSLNNTPGDIYLDIKVGIRAKSGTYRECNTPVFVPVSAYGCPLVPLKRSFVYVSSNDVDEQLDFWPRKIRFCGPPEWAEKGSKTRLAVKRYAGVHLDDGVVTYVAAQTTSFTW